MKQCYLAGIGIFLMGLAVNCGAAKAPSSEEVYYTQANIWYEIPTKIYSTNYHKGTIIPLGTKVTVRTGRDKVAFTTVDSQERYEIIFMRKQSTIPFDEWFDRYFSVKNVLAEGGKFHQCTKKEQENIKQGVIQPGMSKDAVLMAYGYPPSHKTPDLTMETWQYWENRFERIVLHFKNNTLENIEGRKGRRE